MQGFWHVKNSLAWHDCLAADKILLRPTAAPLPIIAPHFHQRVLTVLTRRVAPLTSTNRHASRPDLSLRGRFLVFYAYRSSERQGF